MASIIPHLPPSHVFIVPCLTRVLGFAARLHSDHPPGSFKCVQRHSPPVRCLSDLGVLPGVRWVMAAVTWCTLRVYLRKTPQKQKHLIKTWKKISRITTEIKNKKKVKHTGTNVKYCVCVLVTPAADCRSCKNCKTEINIWAYVFEIISLVLKTGIISVPLPWLGIDSLSFFSY